NTLPATGAAVQRRRQPLPRRSPRRTPRNTAAGTAIITITTSGAGARGTVKVGRKDTTRKAADSSPRHAVLNATERRTPASRRDKRHYEGPGIRRPHDKMRHIVPQKDGILGVIEPGRTRLCRPIRRRYLAGS